MNKLYATNDGKLKRLSSIDQHKDKLSVYSQGGWIPISYDVIKSIGCDGMKSYRAILSLNEDDLGYTFPEKYCYRPKDKYILTEEFGVEKKELAPEYGEGFYEEYSSGPRITNADNGALGQHYKGRERVGLDYYRTEDILPASAQKQRASLSWFFVV